MYVFVRACARSSARTHACMPVLLRAHARMLREGDGAVRRKAPAAAAAPCGAVFSNKPVPACEAGRLSTRLPENSRLSENSLS